MVFCFSIPQVIFRDEDNVGTNGKGQWVKEFLSVFTMSIEDVINNNGSNGKENGRGLSYSLMEPFTILGYGGNGYKPPAQLEEVTEPRKERMKTIYEAQRKKLYQEADKETQELEDQIEIVGSTLPEIRCIKLWNQTLTDARKYRFYTAREIQLNYLMMLVDASPMSEEEKEQIKDKYREFYSQIPQRIQKVISKKKKPVEHVVVELEEEYHEIKIPPDTAYVNQTPPMTMSSINKK